MTELYYFSGTGNTLWSAKRIAELLGGECRLFNIGVEAEKKEPVLEADRLIFLFPVYAFGPPSIVRRFIESAQIRASYTAVIATYGSSPGGALAAISRMLKRKNGGKTFFAGIQAVENYIPIFGPAPEETLKARVARQEEAVENTARNIQAGISSRAPAFSPLSSLVSFLFSCGTKYFYKRYRLSASCDGCGLCAGICPVQAILMKDGRPQFTSTCEHCQACLNWCPQRAISFGRLKPDTPRYHHPGVTMTEMRRDCPSIDL